MCLYLSGPAPPPPRPPPPIREFSNPVPQVHSLPVRPAPIARQEDEDVDTGKWNCSACTFLNHQDLDKCEICEMPKISGGMSGIQTHTVFEWFLFKTFLDLVTDHSGCSEILCS